MSVSFLQRRTAPKLAYKAQRGANANLPTVVFLTGFRSDMMGTKAEFLARFCADRGQNFLRFDYSGHGQSGGQFEDGTIGSWLADTLDVIDTLTAEPVLLIGSSMGGWIGLHTALARPERIRAFIGLAAAPDFTKEIEARLLPQHKAELATKGKFAVQTEYSPEPYYITQNFITDGNNRCLLQAPIDLNIPVRLLQGMKDEEVEWQMAHRINNAITGTDKKVYLVEEGDHRLSRPQDLELLGQQVIALSDKI